MCRTCCKTSHRFHPHHRIEKWNGHFFEPSWLWRVGTIICLGHGGSVCPGYELTKEQLEDRCREFNELGDNDTNIPDDPTFRACPKVQHLGRGKVVTFVHTNSFHHLPIYPCICDKAAPADQQYLAMGFYPTSSSDVSTVFTLAVLKHFHLLKVDAHQSTENYCSILQHLTNFIFPGETPVSHASQTSLLSI
jgi:hypothetical protein